MKIEVHGNNIDGGRGLLHVQGDVSKMDLNMTKNIGRNLSGDMVFIEDVDNKSTSPGTTAKIISFASAAAALKGLVS